jgi:hypothetical protein
MSATCTQTPASRPQYIPKYLFVTGDRQRGTGKSRHVMKECKKALLSTRLANPSILTVYAVLRKRDSLRRQHQSAEKTQSRVLPWLRREDVEQKIAPAASFEQTGPHIDVVAESVSELSSECSSSPESQDTVSTEATSEPSPDFSWTKPVAAESSVAKTFAAQQLRGDLAERGTPAPGHKIWEWTDL